MSNTGKFADRTPGIRQAGLTSALAHESSAVGATPYRIAASPAVGWFLAGKKLR